MKNKELLEQELNQKLSRLEELKKELEKEEKPLDDDPHYAEVCEKIFELENEIGSVPDPKAPISLTAGIAISAIMIVVGFFISKYISFAAIASLIVFCIMRSINLKKAQKAIDTMQAPTKKKLSELEDERDSMREKFPRIHVIESEIDSLSYTASKLKSQIAAINKEEIAMKKALGTENIEQYERNYLFIHVGKHTTSSGEGMLLRHELIIDGQDYGPASLPFSKFEMNPGIHNILLKYQIGDSIYQSQVIQFKADDQSKMIVIKYKSPNIYSKEFTNFVEFLDGISNL